MSQIKHSDLTLSSKDYFGQALDRAITKLHVAASPLSRTYLVDVLQYYMLSQNLFTIDEETGRYKRETLAETFLKAQQLPITQKTEMLKKLGDTSLYISGFFGDSLSRKVVDIDYYAEMGGTAYHALSSLTSDRLAASVYSDFASRFLEFVDVLTCVSQSARVQSNEDLLRLYDRYVSTGSKWAEEQLLEKGLLSADLGKVKGSRQ